MTIAAVYEDTYPFVSVVIPTLNEEQHIAEVISSLQPELPFRYEILVVDGGSTDRTKEIVIKISETDPTVRLLENSKRIQAAAVNFAATQVNPHSRYILRADAHCRYPKGFVAKLYQAMVDSGADSVVVPMLTVGSDTSFQKAVAMAQNSKLGNGGAGHREGGAPSGYVDHGHHALFKLDFFLGNGGYDEHFPVNEDSEFDIRVAKNGAKVWMASDCRIEYFPRRTAAALAKQYFAYGKGRINTVIKHRIVPKLRQMVPVAVTISVALATFLAVFDLRFGLVPAAYLGMCATYAIRLTPEKRDWRFRGLLTSAFAIMHLSWGAGFLVELIRKIRSNCRSDRHLAGNR